MAHKYTTSTRTPCPSTLKATRALCRCHSLLRNTRHLMRVRCRNTSLLWWTTGGCRTTSRFTRHRTITSTWLTTGFRKLLDRQGRQCQRESRRRCRAKPRHRVTWCLGGEGTRQSAYACCESVSSALGLSYSNLNPSRYRQRSKLPVTRGCRHIRHVHTTPRVNLHSIPVPCLPGSHAQRLVCHPIATTRTH